MIAFGLICIGFGVVAFVVLCACIVSGRVNEQEEEAG